MKNKKEIDWKELNERFHFLPKRGYASILIAYPFALYRGISTQRMSDMLITGGKPQVEEYEILQWVSKIGIKLIESFSSEDMEISNKILDEARKIASLYLDEVEIDEAIYLALIAWENKGAPEKITLDDRLFISMISAKRNIDIRDIEIIVNNICKN